MRKRALHSRGTAGRAFDDGLVIAELFLVGGEIRGGDTEGCEAGGIVLKGGGETVLQESGLGKAVGCVNRSVSRSWDLRYFFTDAGHGVTGIEGGVWEVEAGVSGIEAAVADIEGGVENIETAFADIEAVIVMAKRFIERTEAAIANGKGAFETDEVEVGGGEGAFAWLESAVAGAEVAIANFVATIWRHISFRTAEWLPEEINTAAPA